jgi:4-amino-4-deoxy-L-arabinose transferase-like glycosyltransferase
MVVPVAYGVRAGLQEIAVGRQTTVICLFWIGLALVSFFVQGRFLAHYAIPLAVPLGVLSGMGVDAFTQRILTGRRALLAPIFLTLAISGIAAVLAGAMEFEPIQRDRQRAQAVAAVIRPASGEEARTWVWGNEPVVYFEADRLSATRFCYMYPLVTPGYATPELVDQTLQELQASPPQFVVDAGSPTPGQPGFQALLIARPLASDGRDVDLLDPIRDFVRGNYEQLAIADGWVIYELRGAEAARAPTGSSHLRLSATLR